MMYRVDKYDNRSYASRVSWSMRLVFTEDRKVRRGLCMMERKSFWIFRMYGRNDVCGSGEGVADKFCKGGGGGMYVMPAGTFSL